MPGPPIRGREIRRIVLRESMRAGRGHIGSALSVADLVAALVEITGAGSRRNPERDRFILSKGHAALALYAALRLNGTLEQSTLERFCADESPVAAHPDHRLHGVDFSTGSLGFGLSFGAGSALAARLRGSPRRTFVLVSDAELNTGLFWEAAMFAAQHRLGRLTVLIDDNGQQAFGRTRDVLDLAPLAPRFEAFGFAFEGIDGHDEAAIAAALADAGDAEGPPRAIAARTISGRGVTFMENRLEWHYRSMTDAEFARALAEVEAGL